MTSHVIKIAVIGDAGSGKSALIRRFSKKTFDEVTHQYTCSACELFRYEDTQQSTKPFGETTQESPVPRNCRSHKDEKGRRCTCHRQRPTVMTMAFKGTDGKTHFVKLLLMDVPELTRFPENTMQDFEVESARGVTKAHAYILVFDVTKMESFGYISRIRLEIKEYIHNTLKESGMLPSKKANQDERQTSYCSIPLKRSLKRDTEGSSLVYRGSGVSSVLMRNNSDTVSKYSEPVIIVAGTKVDLLPSRKDETDSSQFHKGCLQTVRKSWKYQYVACSGKYGCGVDKVFYAAIESILAAQGLRKKPKAAKR